MGIQKTRRKRIKRHSRKKGGAEEIQSELATKTFWDDNGSYRDGKLLDKVKDLLANGVDVNAVDEHNYTALHYALMKFQMDPRVVSLLLEKDADEVSPKGTHSPRRSMEGGDPEAGAEEVEVLEDDARLGSGGHF